MTRYACICIGVIAASVGACDRVEMDEVYGSYTAKYSFGTDRLSLRPDQSYEQQSNVTSDNFRVTRTGHWEFEKRRRWLASDSVMLRDCLVLDDGWGRLRADYQAPIPRCIYPIQRQGWIGSGSVSLGPDEGIRHERR
jgi:hypothetical protein